MVWLDKSQEPNVLSHIDRLKSTFAAAFPMYDILPVLMEDLIYTVYQNKSTDWLTQEPIFGTTLPPTLNSMSVSVDKVIANRQYEERIERNMKACFHTRIDSLKRGWKGEMLNTVHSTPWNELFQKPCIINLSYVGDDVENILLRLLQAADFDVSLAEHGIIYIDEMETIHSLPISSIDMNQKNGISAEYVAAVANQCHLSAETVYRVISAMKTEGTDLLTSEALIRTEHFSLRVANRVLSALVSGGYAEIVGQHRIGNKGRPQNVHRILLKY